MDSQTADKVNRILTSFEGYALADIKKCSKEGMPIAAFILSMCFIDQLSTYIFRESSRGTDRSKEFVNKYLNQVSKKKYNSNDLITLLRSKLVHNYSIDPDVRKKHGSYLIDFNNPDLHLKRVLDHIVINDREFINDLEKAFILYKNQLLVDDSLQKKAIKQLDEVGIVMAITVTLTPNG